ncbi:uncharacterized [Tachysurus ichikawai]
MLMRCISVPDLNTIPARFKWLAPHSAHSVKSGGGYVSLTRVISKEPHIAYLNCAAQDTVNDIVPLAGISSLRSQKDFLGAPG